MLYDLSPLSVSRINAVLQREHVASRLSRLSIDDQEDIVQEVALAILQDNSNPDLAIRRGVCRWKTTRDIVRVPQGAKRFQVMLRSELESAALE